MTLLQVRDLTKSFDGFHAIDGISLTVDANQVHSIIGPNGAGKTTLFNLLTGAISATSGQIVLDGTDVSDTADHERPYLGISRSYQITNVFEKMTVFENVQTAVAVYHTNYYDLVSPLADDEQVTERANEILDRLDLREESESKASLLSHGDKRLLEIGMALASNPRLLLLDEPTAGMDAGETKRTVNLIEELAEELTVILVEHDIESVMRISDTITVLEQGQVIADGTPKEIRQNQRVQEAYLGGETVA